MLGTGVIILSSFPIIIYSEHRHIAEEIQLTTNEREDSRMVTRAEESIIKIPALQATICYAALRLHPAHVGRAEPPAAVPCWLCGALRNLQRN